MNFLEKAVQVVKKNVEHGYYDVDEKTKTEKRSLRKKLNESFTLVAEIKPVSPTHGPLFSGAATELAIVYAKNGAGALSVLCEKSIFGGTLASVTEAKKTCLPVLAKDFVISTSQLDAYAAVGADAVLLIEKIFAKNLAEEKLNTMIEYAHELGLEVILEAYSKQAFVEALETNTDIVGVNNRNLETLEVNAEHYTDVVDVTRLAKPIIAESGFETREQIRAAKKKGVNGVLIGSSLLRGGEPAEKLRGLL